MPRGHMRLEDSLLTLCPCNNISITSATEQTKIPPTGAFVGSNNLFLIKYEVRTQYLGYYREDVPIQIQVL